MKTLPLERPQTFTPTHPFNRFRYSATMTIPVFADVQRFVESGFLTYNGQGESSEQACYRTGAHTVTYVMQSGAGVKVDLPSGALLMVAFYADYRPNKTFLVPVDELRPVVWGFDDCFIEVGVVGDRWAFELVDNFTGPAPGELDPVKLVEITVIENCAEQKLRDQLRGDYNVAVAKAREFVEVPDYPVFDENCALVYEEIRTPLLQLYRNKERDAALIRIRHELVAQIAHVHKL